MRPVMVELAQTLARSADETSETHAHACVLAFQFHSPTDTNASIPHIPW